MKDSLIKAMACEGRVRIFICATTELVEEARQRFDLWPTSAAALGRTLSVGSMMGSMLKSDIQGVNTDSARGELKPEETKEQTVEEE